MTVWFRQRYFSFCSWYTFCGKISNLPRIGAAIVEVLSVKVCRTFAGLSKVESIEWCPRRSLIDFIGFGWIQKLVLGKVARCILHSPRGYGLHTELFPRTQK